MKNWDRNMLNEQKFNICRILSSLIAVEKHNVAFRIPENISESSNSSAL